jgi:hypothetical protein
VILLDCVLAPINYSSYAACTHAQAKRDLTDLAAQCAQEAALGCSRELFMSTCFQRVRIWGDRPQDSARRLARETKLALVWLQIVEMKRHSLTCGMYNVYMCPQKCLV